MATHLVAERIKEPFDLFRFPFDDQFDASVGAIANKTCHFESARNGTCGIAKTNALDVTGKENSPSIHSSMRWQVGTALIFLPLHLD